MNGKIKCQYCDDRGICCYYCIKEYNEMGGFVRCNLNGYISWIEYILIGECSC